jgi:hypothetical protein
MLIGPRRRRPTSRPSAARARRRIGGVGAALALVVAATVGAPASVPQAPVDVPVHATRLPPATTLEYDLARGVVSGRGRIDWQPAGERYTLTMEGRAMGVQLISWTSRGALGSNGLAPVSFIDKRFGRDPMVATFQREAGRITYTGPKGPRPERAWVPGVQDRLSWLVQLPAILAAQPSLRQPGQRIDLYVTGARANAHVWTFVVRGLDTVRLADGVARQTLHLQRAAREPGEGPDDAWLDPARGFLPVRAHLGGDGEPLELLLRP